MRTQRTFQRDASPLLVGYIVIGASSVFLDLLIWLAMGWKWAALFWVLCVAHAFWKLVGSAPEVQDLVADLWHRWGTVRHA